MAQQLDIECKVWKVFKKSVPKAGRWKEIRVVSWVSKGTEFGPNLENREMMDLYETGTRMGKAKGFSADEVKFLVENSGDIIDLMEKRLKPEEVAVGADGKKEPF